MGHRSWIFIGCVLLGGLLLTLAALPGAGVLAPATWLAFATLTAFATFTRLYKTLFQSKQHVDTGALSYSPTLVFLFAGIFLLPPVLFPMLVISAYTVEWAKERWQKSPILRAWYIQPFNIATHVLAATAARWVYGAMQLPSSVGFSPSLLFAAILAALVYVGVNHLLIGQALVLARNVSWAETGVWQAENLQPDLIMLALGYAMALLWQLNPWFIVLALSPLVLIYQAIKVPQLKKDAQTDGKTGLLNASYFNKLFAAALERALQTNQPLAFIMVDLDLLRNINNTYGHLAGDRVLAGVGRLIREAIRADDLAGRFGGEEFMIVLPGAGQAEALALAERLRRAVEATGFAPANSPTPIVATISLGLACFPEQGRTLLSLTHAADLAVYQAKLTGRNRVVSAGDIPHSITLESIPGAAPAVSEAPTVLSSPLQPEGAPATVPNAPAVPIVDAGGAPPPRLSMAALDLRALPQQPTTPPPPAHAPSRVLGLFLSIVIGTGLVLALLGIAFSPPLDWVGVGLLMALAVICEYLQVNVYGDNTASVSIAIIFAAALITGVPGVLLVSAAVTLTHYLRMHPPAVRTVFFNWAIHVIAGSATVLIMHTLPFDLQITNLLLLLVPASGAAMAAYFLETGLVASAIHLSTGASLVGTWRAQFQWLAGHYLVLCLLGLFLAIAQGALGPVGVIVFTLPVLMMRYAQQQYVERTRESMRELKRMNEELAHANREIMTASRSIRQLNDELFQTLAKILDARDPYVGGHAEQVARYASRIGQELGLPAAQLEILCQAGYLHDIGKIVISEQVLHKPGKLTEEEYEYVKTHTVVGGGFLETSQALRHLAPFIRGHHERWDGTGYPDGLRGEAEIPLEARILAVCDAVEAMASDRPYQKGKSVSEIITEVQRCAGAQFDPTVVDVFVRLAAREGAELIVNSARDVVRRQLDRGSTRELPALWFLPPTPALHNAFSENTRV